MDVNLRSHSAFHCLKPSIVTLCYGAWAQIPVRQVKSKRGTSKIYVCGICVYLELLVDVRQVRVVPVPVAFQVEPVLSFVVRVGSLLKPSADLKQQDWNNMTKSRHVKQQQDTSNHTHSIRLSLFKPNSIKHQHLHNQCVQWHSCSCAFCPEGGAVVQHFTPEETRAKAKIGTTPWAKCSSPSQVQ